MSATAALQVLFIIGKGRSGSTVLGDILGGFPSVFHMGEAWRLWSHGIIGPHLCSCGVRAEVCRVWSEVLRGLSTGPSAWAVERPAEVARLQKGLFSFGGIARSKLRGSYRRGWERYRALARDLYETSAAVTGSRTLVDSSKWPLDPVLLNPPEAIDPYALHLVRNPRSVAASWRKPRTFPDSHTPMPRFGGIHTSLSWTSRTWAAERIVGRLGTRGMTLRFEDLLADPAGKIEEIGRMLAASWSLDISDSRRLRMLPGHTIMGNPSRFTSGEVELLAEEGRVRDPLVGALTWPWRRRFGY